MKITPTIVKRKLDSAISDISDISWLYSQDPNSDFSRKRKLPMDSMFRLLLKFSGKSLQNELSAYYRCALKKLSRMTVERIISEDDQVWKHDIDGRR